MRCRKATSSMCWTCLTRASVTASSRTTSASFDCLTWKRCLTTERCWRRVDAVESARRGMKDEPARRPLKNCYSVLDCRSDPLYSVVGIHHRLRGSASPVLTATGFVSGKGQFSPPPHRIDTPQPITKTFVTGDYIDDPYVKSKNVHIIKTTASIPTKFCTVIKTTKCPSRVVPTHALQIQDGGRPPSRKNRKIVISQPLFERF